MLKPMRRVRTSTASPTSRRGSDRRCCSPPQKIDPCRRGAVITFETSNGIEHRVIGFSRPDSITDDLDPFGSLSVLGGGLGGAEEFGQ